jgi:chemotaxis protein methyltransferase CheR/two-component system CheB/CheR fusion protein
LQASNEELQSTNEEFQATNEELETANEELQSTNEELLTVNEELQISSAERLALASELEATMASAPYVVALADQALMLRRVSNVGLKFLRLDEVPPRGVHLSQCELPAGFPALAPIANSVLRLQEQRSIPVLSNGTYYSMVMSPVLDPHKKMIGLAITITEFDDAPLEQVIGLMTKVTDVAYWTYNLDTEELHWSPGMFRIFGFDSSGNSPSWEESLRLVHPADRAKIERQIDEMLEGADSYTYNVRVFDKEGRVLQVAGSTTLLRDSTGQPSQMVGVIWDTASRVQNELQLAHLKSVQEDLHLGFFSFDVENNTRIWSDVTYDILGYERVVHRPSVESLVKAFVQEDQDPTMQAFVSVLETGAGFSRTVTLARGQNAGKKCEIKGMPWVHQGERVSHVYGSVRLLPPDDDA